MNFVSMCVYSMETYMKYRKYIIIKYFPLKMHVGRNW